MKSEFCSAIGQNRNWRGAKSYFHLPIAWRKKFFARGMHALNSVRSEMFIERAARDSRNSVGVKCFFANPLIAFSEGVQHDTPSELKNSENCICYKQFTPKGVRRHSISDITHCAPARKIPVKPKRLLNFAAWSFFAILAPSLLIAQTQSLRTAEFSSGGEVTSDFVAILGQPSPVDLTTSTSGDTLASGVLPTYFYPAIFSVRTSVPFATRTRASDYQSHEYRLVGLPGASNRSASEFLAGKQNESWQVYRDNGKASDFFEKFDGSANFLFSAGRGFWIIQKGPLTINTNVPAAPLDASEVANIPLQPDWNIITNPFPAPVSWSAVQTANGNFTESLWDFLGTAGFQKSNTLEPNKGYYFCNTNVNRILLQIPYSMVFSSAASTANEATLWRVEVALSTGEFSDHSASFGISPRAKADLDPFDERKPRALAATPTVEFKRPTWDASYSTFATDIRPEFEASESWEFDVRATSREAAQLTFSGISKIPGRFEIYLLDADHAQSLNLREDSLYRFTPAAELMKFKVVVGRKDKVQEQLSSLALPKEFALGPNYPNPFNRSTERSRRSPTTTIPIAVPVASEIKLKLYNFLGAEVKTLYDGTIEAGRYWFNWDGRNELGNQVATGVYLYRLTTKKGLSLLGKMILIR